MPRLAERLRVLIADDHELYRRELVMALDDADDLEVVAEAETGGQAVEQALALAPDVVVMDVRMPGVGGIEAARQLAQEMPTLRVLMLSASDDSDDLIEAVKAGAAGYLLKETSVAEIRESVRGVALGHGFVAPRLAGRLMEEFASMARRLEPDAIARSGRPIVSAAEIEVLEALANGADNAAIAATTAMSERAVRTHVGNILEKLQLASRTEAVLYAVREKLIDP